MDDMAEIGGKMIIHVEYDCFAGRPNEITSYAYHFAEMDSCFYFHLKRTEEGMVRRWKSILR